MDQNKRVLLVTAHADDHTAAAGTVFKLCDQGYQVFELILTTSNEGRDFRNPDGKYDVAQLRDAEFSEASKFLGTEKIWRFGQEDLNLQYSKQIVFEAVNVIREVRPNVGIIMNPFDWHPDHIAAYQIGSTAFKLAATGIKPELGEHHRTAMVLAVEGMLPIKPNVLVDITNYYRKKEELFKIYESQASSKTLGFQEGLAKVRGYHIRRVGSMMAEAFTMDETSPCILFD
jgi:LmbE family N-acetylglucosaminyl deacetylase